MKFDIPKKEVTISATLFRRALPALVDIVVCFKNVDVVGLLARTTSPSPVGKVSQTTLANKGYEITMKFQYAVGNTSLLSTKVSNPD